MTTKRDGLEIGTRVYYTGDMANPDSGFGHIVEHVRNAYAITTRTASRTASQSRQSPWSLRRRRAAVSGSPTTGTGSGWRCGSRLTARPPNPNSHSLAN
jgi:hypothetical protein